LYFLLFLRICRYSLNMAIWITVCSINREMILCKWCNYKWWWIQWWWIKWIQWWWIRWWLIRWIQWWIRWTRWLRIRIIISLVVIWWIIRNLIVRRSIQRNRIMKTFWLMFWITRKLINLRIGILIRYNNYWTKKNNLERI